MRKHYLLFLQLGLLSGFTVGAMAQNEHITPFTGTWNLNLAESKFDPGPPFKAFTLTFTPDGTRKLELIGADGKPLKVTLPWSDGREVHVFATEGMEDATATSKIRGNAFNDTWRQKGKVIERVHGVVSSDRRTLTITVDGPTKQGGAFNNRLQFDRQ